MNPLLHEGERKGIDVTAIEYFGGGVRSAGVSVATWSIHQKGMTF